MDFFVSLFKRLVGSDDDDRSSSPHRDPVNASRNAPLTRQSNSSTGVYDPSLYRDPQPFPKRNSPQASQPSSRVTNSRFRTSSESYSSQETHTSKQPSNSNWENFAKSQSLPSLSPNVIVNSSKSESPKPPPIFTKPTISEASPSYSSPQNKNAYIWAEKNASSTYVLSKDIKSSIEKVASAYVFPKDIKSESPKASPISTKPIISAASSSFSSPQNKNAYIWVEKGASSTYVFPKDIKSLIEKDIVPSVLKMPLSKSSYKDYFHALLYAEDRYLEKWDGFEMKNVKVDLHQATIYTKRGNKRSMKYGEDKDEIFFVAFELDKIRERRPFLISRDFVSMQPTEQTIKPFQGVIYRVWKSNLVLAEFGQEFFYHHHPDAEYDVKFSFNRVCLKRAHQAIAAASESLLNNLLFPNIPPKQELSYSQRYIHQKEPLAVGQILRLEGLPPYLVEGPLAIERDNLSKTGKVVVEAIIGILQADPSKKILLCAPMNRTCDVLMRGLKREIAESEMFRANAAFREVDGVPEDILSSCLYKDDKEYFSCPEFAKLKKYKVISTTFMSSYRLYGEGIKAGYFSHIFVVDASSATEPEAMVPLANFVTAKTVVVVTGAPGNRSGWIRSKIARENGLLSSYFERLRNSALYQDLDAKLVVQLEAREEGKF